MIEGLDEDSQTLTGGRNNEGPVLFREPGLFVQYWGQVECPETHRILS